MEQWFQQQFKSHVTVDFMGNVSWFLRQCYEWHNAIAIDGLSCHVSQQQAFVKGMINKHRLNKYITAKTSFQSGLKIDYIAHDGVKPEDTPKRVKTYQSIMGGNQQLVLHQLQTHKLLSLFNGNPSQGHLDAAKYVLIYLSTPSSHRLRFKQQHANRLARSSSFTASGFYR